MRTILRTACLAAALAPIAAASGAAPPGGAPDTRDGGRCVMVGEIRGVISVVTKEYVRESLEAARAGRCEMILFLMDTPGGTVAATEEIIQDILASKVPVGVYVSPAGAQAASAGLYITNAADIAAMAPGTRIGAGHPVFVSPTGDTGGPTPGRDYLGEKVEHDSAAGVRSIATIRGRNAEVYEKMVRQSISLTEREALDQDVIDLVARDQDDLLRSLDGREVTRFDGTKQTLSLAGARTERLDMSGWQIVLSWLAHPQVTVLLLSIGMLGLYVEFNHPGLILPGVIGAVALVLFLMSLQILPINVLGLLLIALAITLFILEVKFTSYGLLTLGGAVCLTLGFVTLIDPAEMPGIRVSLAFILPTSITVALVMLALTTLAVRAQRSRVVTGAAGLTGEIGEAVTDIAAEGKVFVHGEYWNARAERPIARGRKVRVRSVHDMNLDVEPIEG